ncbi:MAG: AMP-binding protein [Candidatus Omnitrophota bacterium]|nr:AMP-binding protein [Candidatus Omnitrophota bacterium]
MPQEMVINYLFRKIAGEFPKKTCLQIEKDGIWEKYTYGRVEELSRRAAAFLMNEGIGKGDFVILMLNNCPEWAISYLGILHSGACVVPVDAKIRLI